MTAAVRIGAVRMKRGWSEMGAAERESAVEIGQQRGYTLKEIAKALGTEWHNVVIVASELDRRAAERRKAAQNAAREKAKAERAATKPAGPRSVGEIASRLAAAPQARDESGAPRTGNRPESDRRASRGNRDSESGGVPSIDGGTDVARNDARDAAKASEPRNGPAPDKAGTPASLSRSPDDGDKREDRTQSRAGEKPAPHSDPEAPTPRPGLASQDQPAAAKTSAEGAPAGVPGEAQDESHTSASPPIPLIRKVEPVVVPNVGEVPQAPPGVSWTAARVEYLRRRHSEGASAGVIARELGLSRNAVIGKIARLGLRGFGQGRNPSGDTLRKPKTPRPPKPVAPKAKPPAPKPAPVAPAAPDVATIELTDLPAGEMPATAVRFLDTEARHCRWPVGNWAGPVETRHCCGHEKLPDSSYCSFHHARSRGKGTKGEQTATAVAAYLIGTGRAA